MDRVLKIETYTDQLIFDAGKKAFEAGLREGRQSGEKLGIQLGMAAGRREGFGDRTPSSVRRDIASLAGARSWPLTAGGYQEGGLGKS